MHEDFDTLIEANAPRIRQIALRYAPASDVEDLCQEIYLALWRSLSAFRGESTVTTWVYRVALNTALTGLRKRARTREGQASLQVTLEMRESAEAAGIDPADTLSAFLDRLSEVDASVLMMHLDGLDTSDIAGVLGMTPNSVQVRMSRIRKRFDEEFVD